MARFSETPSNLDIRWLGSIEDHNFFYQELDALLMTSDKEALPTVVLEALCRQIPIFSFADLPGVQEIMGETALLARDRNGSDLAKRVIQFFLEVEQPAALKEWRKAAWERSWRFALENQWKAFQEVLTGTTQFS